MRLDFKNGSFLGNGSLYRRMESGGIVKKKREFGVLGFGGWR